MLKRIGTLLVALVAASSVAAAASASNGHSHAIKFTIVQNDISSTSANPNGPPAVGTVFVSAGIVTQKPGGSGASVDHLTVTSISLSNRTDTLAGRTTIFLARGTMTAKLAVADKVSSNGNITFRGTGTYVGGTGTYKGIVGHFSFTGQKGTRAGIGDHDPRNGQSHLLDDPPRPPGHRRPRSSVPGQAHFKSSTVFYSVAMEGRWRACGAPGGYEYRSAITTVLPPLS